jgi:flagellar basal-body rod modification protein FlgD
MSGYSPNSIVPLTGKVENPNLIIPDANAPAAKKDNALMGKDDFLKLLVGQLKNQDPLEPKGDSEFIGQMTQFSQLEQQTNTAASTNDIAAQLAHTSALGLIGRTVTYLDADGNSQTGKVEQVDTVDGKATLTVGGKAGIDAGKVTQVK